MTHRGPFIFGTLSLLVILLVGTISVVSAPKADEKAQQPLVVKSNYSFADTIAKLREAIQAKKLAIVYEANHKNMMAMVGIESKNSVNIGFAKPQMGNQLLTAEPRAAIDVPLRVAVREMDNGDIVVIYYQPSYLFSHYNNPKLDKVGQMADKMVASLVKSATE